MRMVRLSFLVLLHAICQTAPTLHTHPFVANAAPSWRKVSTTGAYRGRGETGFSSCGPNRLCLVGGRGANRVDILDVGTLTWTEGVSNDMEMHHFQALEGPDGCVWVAGAWTGPYPNEGSVEDIWRYCPDSDQWSVVDSIERPRGAGGAVFHNGKLYLVGGNVGGHNPTAQLVAYFDEYDPVTKTWVQLPDIPRPRDHFHSVVHEGKLYVVGGRDSTSTPEVFFNDPEPAVDVYDFSSGAWSTDLPDFPRPRGGTSTTIFKGSVYVLAGEGFGRAWKEVDVLQTDGRFVPGVNMTEARHGTGVVGCDEAMWIVGGATGQGGGPMATDTFAFFEGDVPKGCRTGEDASPPPMTSPPPTTVSTKTTMTTTTTTTIISSTTTIITGTTVPESTNPSESATVETPSPTTTPAPVTRAPPPSQAASSVSPAVSPSPAAVDPGSNPSASPALSPSPSSLDDTLSPSPSVSEATNDTNQAERVPDCFPGDAMVELEDGSVKTMRQLALGDSVKVGHPNTYSAVYFFSHQHAEAAMASVYVETSVSGTALTLSPGHLVRANGAELVPAGDLRVGDVVQVGAENGAGVDAKVVRVSRRLGRGRFNPHTVHGDIVVNGMTVSTFTTAVRPTVARVLLAPFRAVFRVFGSHRRVVALNGMVLKSLDRFYWRQ